MNTVMQLKQDMSLTEFLGSNFPTLLQMKPKMTNKCQTGGVSGFCMCVKFTLCFFFMLAW